MSMLLLFGDDAAGSAPLSYDPADLPWAAGAKRFWWHFDDDPVWTGTSGSGAQASAVGDAVASLQSGSDSDTYWMNQGGGTSFIRGSDGVEIPIWAYMIGSVSGVESATGGFTVGFCGYVSSGSIGSSKFCAGGEDASPIANGLAFESDGVSVAGDTAAKYTATIDWTLPHSVVASAEYIAGDGTLTGRIWLDGVLVLTQTGLTAGQWTRDLLYNIGGGAVWNMRSRFFAAQAFTGAGDIALIDRYLCLGSNPPIPSGGWSAWLAAQKASWEDYGYHEDLTRLWQDYGATTPVTAAGDVVGAWRGQKDALTFIQPNSSYRGVYRTAGIQFDATGGTVKRLYAPLSHNYASPITLGMGVYNISTTQPMRFGLQDTDDTTNLPIIGWTQTAGVQATRIRGTSTNMTTAAGSRTYVVSYNGTAARLIDSTGALSSPTVGSSTTSGTNLVLAASPSAGNGRWLTWVVKLASMTDEELTYTRYWMRYRRHLE